MNQTQKNILAGTLSVVVGIGALALIGSFMAPKHAEQQPVAKQETQQESKQVKSKEDVTPVSVRKKDCTQQTYDDNDRLITCKIDGQEKELYWITNFLSGNLAADLQRLNMFVDRPITTSEFSGKDGTLYRSFATRVQVRGVPMTVLGFRILGTSAGVVVFTADVDEAIRVMNLLFPGSEENLKQLVIE